MILLMGYLLVPGAGVEPARTIRPRDFKSLESTIPPPRQKFEARAGIEPT